MHRTKKAIVSWYPAHTSGLHNFTAAADIWPHKLGRLLFWTCPARPGIDTDGRAHSVFPHGLESIKLARRGSTDDSGEGRLMTLESVDR